MKVSVSWFLNIVYFGNNPFVKHVLLNKTNRECSFFMIYSWHRISSLISVETFKGTCQNHRIMIRILTVSVGCFPKNQVESQEYVVLIFYHENCFELKVHYKSVWYLICLYNVAVRFVSTVVNLPFDIGDKIISVILINHSFYSVTRISNDSWALYMLNITMNQNLLSVLQWQLQIQTSFCYCLT